MFRYYVEYRLYKNEPITHYIYVKAYSSKQVREMIDVYEIIVVDQTD